ncbi:hypothetical protein FHG87_003193 [Trinorchestia longiramus]|nr:hypothetical protein FHG87_003193 [Trinorchestia longiramus]
MDQSTKFYDERYEFHAPKQIDFTNFHEDGNEDSFFDCQSEGLSRSLPDMALKGDSSASKTPKGSLDAHAPEQKPKSPLPDGTASAAVSGNSAAVSGNSDAALGNSAAASDNSAAALGNSAAALGNSAAASDNSAAASDNSAAASGSSDHAEAMICDTDNACSNETSLKIENAGKSEVEHLDPADPQPVAELHKDDDDEHMEIEQSDEVQELGEKRLTRSSRKGPLGSDGVFQQPPMRHSPRLAAIAKALTTSGGSRNSSSGFKGRRRSVSAGPGNRAAAAAAKTKGGSGSLSVEERAHLAQFAQLADTAAATRRQRTHSNSGRDVRLRTTKPVEFHFSTDHRLKGATKSTAKAAAAPGVASAADFAKTLRSCAVSLTRVACSLCWRIQVEFVLSNSN